MKTAIVLYGYLRTWNLCKDSIIDTMNMLCGDDKDWFIGLWATKTSTHANVNNYLKLKKQNIVSSRWIDPSNNLLLKHNDPYIQTISRVPGSSSGPAYLRQIISLDKRKHEYRNNIKYDRVLFIRPDVVYYTDGRSVERYNDSLSYRQADLAMQLAGDFFDNYSIGGPSANDMIPIGGLLSSDIYSHMYLDLTPPHDPLYPVHLRGGMCPHALLSKFTNTHMIRTPNYIGQDHYLAARIIRPNSNVKQILSELHDWDGKNLSYCGAAFNDYNEWMRGSSEQIAEQINLCKSLGIDLKDYNFKEPV
jgi:hypothetical protein